MQDSTSSAVRLFRREAASRVLGPGTRAVLWVQGCSLACPGCLVPQSWPLRRSDTLEMSVQEVSQWLLSIPEIEGVTLSGGEPMQQAGLLAEVLRQVRPHRDLGVVCYTGYRYEALRLPSQKALLEHVDLLIDGPYRQDLHADLLWRASSNQRLLCLTNRYVLPADRSAGLEWSFQPDGRMAFAGVPPWPDYVASLS